MQGRAGCRVQGEGCSEGCRVKGAVQVEGCRVALQSEGCSAAAAASSSSKQQRLGFTPVFSNRRQDGRINLEGLQQREGTGISNVVGLQQQQAAAAAEAASSSKYSSSWQ